MRELDSDTNRFAEIYAPIRAHLVIQSTSFRVRQHDLDVLFYGLQKLTDSGNGSARACKDVKNQLTFASVRDFTLLFRTGGERRARERSSSQADMSWGKKLA